MPDPPVEDLERRLAAVERAVTGSDRPITDLADAGDVADRLDDLEHRVATVEERLDDLAAASQAVRGYLGGVRVVNAEVERRADAALAAVERLETRLDGERADRPGPAGDAVDGAVSENPTGHDPETERTPKDLATRLRELG